MAQQAEMLTTNPDNMNLTQGTHLVEGEPLSQAVLW